MESRRDQIGESELDLIEMMDEVILESSSLSSFMQMALDLICFGLKIPSGGLIVLPNLRQQTIQAAWHNPQPGWADADGMPAEIAKRHIGHVQQDSQSSELDGILTLPVINRKKKIGNLLLAGGNFSPLELETLLILTRMIGQRVRNFQASTATIGRDQVNSLLRTISLGHGSTEEFKQASEKIVFGMLKAYNAKGIILMADQQGIEDGAFRHVYRQNGQLPEVQKTRFSSGLLHQCLNSGELMQWGNVASNVRINREIDLISGLDSDTLVGVPLVISGNKLGVMGILDSRLFPLDPVDQSLAMSIAGSLAQTIHSGITSEQLKKMDDELMLKKAEAANSRTALRVLFESTPFLFYIINQEFQIVAINSSRAKLAGSTAAETIGKVCYEALFKSSEICKGCLVSTTLQTGQSTSRTKRTWVKDTPTDWDVNCYAINTSKGVTVQAVISEQDVTEKRRMEAELLQNEKLVAAGQLAASVAHEINNPLAAVIANAQLLLKDIPPESQDLIESVKLIELAGLRASHVVKNLLGLARREEYEFTPVDINESIQDALSLLSHEFVSRPIGIRFERGQNLPPIMASRENMESIWINLLMNSIESIDADSGSIEINTFYDEGNFYVLFKDSGIGIPEEQLGRIFEPFFTTKSHGRGTGLGLSLVKRIVRAHSGSIQVDSEIGKGTTFTVILPAVQPDVMPKNIE